jgi:hypothetical protein
MATTAKAKSGRANELNYPIVRKKTSQNGRRMLRIFGWKGVSGALLRPFAPAPEDSPAG